MPELTDLELDEHLAELERDLGPALRRIYTGSSMRPEFAASAPVLTGKTPVLRIVSQRGWAALAAGLVGALAIGAAVFAIRPQPASASEVLGQLQAEANAGWVSLRAPGCGPDAGAPDTIFRTGGQIAIGMDGPGNEPGGPLTTSSGPTTMASANELSDKLAAALGVSGDQVRAAMLATVQSDAALNAPPPDPMETIARQLGVSRQQVCSAFLQGPGAITGFRMSGGDPGKLPPHPKDPPGANIVDLNTVTADQLKDQAQKLGVSPERVLAAVKASVTPPPAPPVPPNPDQIIRRFAQNLGMPEDRVRAALTQVEGNHGFYFAVPLPNLSH